MARVHCSDEVWTQFKAASGNTPVSVALGDLVQRKVDRHQSKRLREGALEDAELLDALTRARELQTDWPSSSNDLNAEGRRTSRAVAH